MKNILLVMCIFFLVGCDLFDTEKTLLRKYTLKNGENLELWSVGSGTTDVDDIWIFKTRNNQKKVKDTFVIYLV